MRYEPSHAELLSLDQMSQKERFNFAVSRIIECEEVWSLGNADEGWVLRDVEEAQVITIWPYRMMAEAFVQGEPGASTHSVSLEHFMYSVLDKCRAAQIDIEVAPAVGDVGSIICAEALSQMLNDMVESGTYFLEG
jgi:hypothetical protein